MRTQRLVWVLTSVVGFPGTVVALPLGCLFGCLAIIPLFFIVLLALSLVYAVLVLAPLIALSWLWLRVPVLRLPVAVIGVPWAVLGYAFVFLIPEVDEDQSPKISKLLFTECWPYSWAFLQWDLGRASTRPREREELLAILARDTRGVAAWRDYVARRGAADAGNPDA